MFNRQSIHISLLLWGCIFCLLAVFCMSISRENDREKKKYMFLMQLSCAILLGSDAAAWAFRGTPGTLGNYMVHISNFLVFAFSDIVLLLYHIYVCSCIFEKDPQEKKKNRRVKLVTIICLTALCLVVLSQFTNLYYYIDADNYYHRNTAYFLSLLLPMTAMLTDLSLLLEYRKNISRELLAAMVSYIVLPFAGAVILLFYYGISLINLAICISVILMFAETMIEQSKKAAQKERLLAEQERKLAEQERQLAKRERELTDSRIASMMSQIRNHFIFNTLGAISGYCKIDPAKADEALMKFSRYLRRNMSWLDEKGMIPFENELKQVEDYVYLEKMRFGDRFEFGEDLEDINFTIPPLTVQPLVENAIKHGLTRPGKQGSVCLMTSREPDAVLIQVVDDGIGFKPEELEKGTSIGLRNVRYRLEHLAGAELTVESTPGEGTKAMIRIPLAGGEE